MVENCGSCIFWNKVVFDRGQCRRHAPGGPYPFMDSASSTKMVDIWPNTEERDFCGDWELKDAG